MSGLVPYLGEFDCIYVDVLHDCLLTYEDMAVRFFRLAPHGTMIGDDYGFVGWPEKTHAVNDFIRIARPLNDALGCLSCHVYTGDMGNWLVPAEKSNVLTRLRDRIVSKVGEAILAETKVILGTGKCSDIVPNLPARCI